MYISNSRFWLVSSPPADCDNQWRKGRHNNNAMKATPGTSIKLGGCSVSTLSPTGKERDKINK